MENLFVFGITFIIVYAVMLIIHYNKKFKKKLASSRDINALIHKFKLNKKKLNYEALGLLLAFVNSLIIAVIVTVIGMINLHYVWLLAIAFVMMMSLIYISYASIGFYLKRKEVKK